MSQDPLKDALEVVRARVQAELETHLAAVERQQTEAVAAARQAALAEAETRQRAEAERLRAEAEARQREEAARVRAEADAQLEAALAQAAADARRDTEARVQAAVAEAETRQQKETERLRAEAEARQREEAARVRAEADARLEAALAQAAADARRDTEARVEAAVAEAETRQQKETERLRAEAEARQREEAARVRAEADARLEAAVAHAGADVRREADARLQAALAEAETRQRVVVDRLRAEAQTRLEAARVDADARLQAALAEAAAEAGRRLDAERHRVRAESEQAAGNRVRQELAPAMADLENRLNAIGARSDGLAQDLDAERQRAQALAVDLQAARAAIEDVRAELESAHHALHAEQASSRAAVEASASFAQAHVSEREAQLARMAQLLEGVRALARARSLTDVLRGVAAAARAQASRAAVFLIRDGELRAFAASGFEAELPSRLSAGDGRALHDAAASGGARSLEPANAPSFASLAGDRAGLAVPLIVGGEPVAVVYADNAGDAAEYPAAWPESVELLCHHASAVLNGLTALRTAQAMRVMQRARRGPGTVGDASSARRYARLLISEIKLYNEPAVRAGREHRDLLTRLSGEIARARRIYYERVPADVPGRDACFDQELRQILADGDESLLGARTVTP